MPITGRTAKACFDTFATHVRSLLAETVCKHRHVRLDANKGTNRAVLTFAEPDGKAAALDTAPGKLYFYASQQLDVVPESKKRFRLRTLRYFYRLQSGPELSAKNALLRWEYDRAKRGGDRPCRHHMHAPVELAFDGGKLCLDDVHVPTGWVTIEEVIRFLILEIGHKPPCGTKWPDALADSERAFFEDFTSKRYISPK